MAKWKMVGCILGLGASLLAGAQNSHPGASSGKSTPDPGRAATKPLTPKSAMPAPHKSAAAAPSAGSSNQKTNQELTRLERQNAGAPSGKSKTTKSPSVKSGDPSSSRNPAINATYQKPAGGMRATTPAPNTKNPSVPRVNKPN